MSCERQRGGGKLSTILVLLVVAAAVYGAVKVIPAYVANYELEDFMRTEARFAVVYRRTPEVVRQSIFKKMQELEIPAGIESVRVETRMNSTIITVTYSVEVDFLGMFKFNLNFEPTTDERRV